MKDNQIKSGYRNTHVVNCFQKLLSSWWRTTYYIRLIHPPRLWIAFKNYYLRDEGQPNKYTLHIPKRCELLSKIIIFVMKDNIERFFKNVYIVVNCFQKLLSSWWRTTWFIWFPTGCVLWIAFKNYYLRDEGQHLILSGYYKICCELLSKIIIFVMKDNSSLIFCFLVLLWIAFKNYYLRDEGQLHAVS